MTVKPTPSGAPTPEPPAPGSPAPKPPPAPEPPAFASSGVGPGPRPALGVSTSVLHDRRALHALLPYEPDVVEFYNYPGAMVPELARFCGRHGIRPALHTPVPYDLDEPLRRFAPTGPDPVEAALALRLARQTIRLAADLDAVHVVVHFPSPYPPYPSEGFAERCAEFLRALDETARSHRVSVLVENLTGHPLLHTPEQYARVLDGTELGLCLDLGHAHLLGERGTPLRFGQLLGPRVRSMHVYNTTPDRYPHHGHEAAAPGQSSRDGYLDLGVLLPRLLALTRPQVVVMEHNPWPKGPQDRHGPRQTAAWLRRLIDQAPGPDPDPVSPTKSVPPHRKRHDDSA
ncbi:Sugar phosphate isomerase/epimerase [Streptomyces sp. yr375]|uniref:sugar phosphate isomerase/epimerase family protein n=1 Tax=Streptomyces sp. yr375 TaxID=1761906 RepID=UPI0008D6CF42|nr:sugar phosphate isomerase/epimerase family protein [Streptomyces sp. yr375]SER74465.1 Sugar phosphate isomerase/epimerase [Streptomyces sp. yr375]